MVCFTSRKPNIMFFKRLFKIRKVFFMNVRVYYNGFECYYDTDSQFEEEKSYIKVNEKKKVL